jgi:hypothetical protein
MGGTLSLSKERQSRSFDKLMRFPNFRKSSENGD